MITTMTTTTTHGLTDAAVLLRRNVTRMRRYPSMTLMLIGQPVVFLLLFVYVFGATLGRGLPGVPGTRGEYLGYVTPAILTMAVASIALGTAVSVAMDMTSGVVARLRTMSISRSAVLTAHVIAAMLQTAMTLLVVIAVAFAIGLRTSASPVQWLIAAALLAAFGLALTWLTVAFGVLAKSVESASNTPMLLVLLPFLGSGFVPTGSMPGWLAAFANNQPFTPVMDALRGLLAGRTPGHDLVLAFAWSAGLAVTGYVWARRLYVSSSVRVTA